MNEKRIYVIVPRTVKPGQDVIVQPNGRMAAQACHVVSQLRHESFVTLLHNLWKAPIKLIREFLSKPLRFEPRTTIILEARDTNELFHVWNLVHKAGYEKSMFYDTNPQAYGTEGIVPTSMAYFATKDEAYPLSGYLPLFD